MILDENPKSFSKFNMTKRRLLITFTAPGEEEDPTIYLREYTTALTNFLANEVPSRDLLVLRIRNT